MDTNDFQDLIAFLSKKFDSLDERLDALRKESREGLETLRQDVGKDIQDIRKETQDIRKELRETRFELKEDNVSNLRQMGVMIEASSHKIDIVIEGQQDIWRTVNVLRDDVERLSEKIEKLELRHLAHVNDAKAHPAGM
jgi:chromosome segregation ATPase